MGVRLVLLRHGESELNIPTGFPLVYELDKDLKAQEHYYLGDAEEIREATSSVAAQASIAKNGRSEGSE